MLLVIDSDPLVSVVVRRAMEGVSHRLFTAPDGVRGLAEIEKRQPHVVVLNSVLPGSEGVDLLPQVHDLLPNSPVLFITERGSGASAIEAAKRSAYDYLPKPLEPTRIRARIDRALAHRRRLLEVKIDEQLERRLAPRELAPRLTDPLSLVGDCPAMQSVFKAIGKVAIHDVAVLIRGEHGTGKEEVAREIHAHSPRADGPLISFACRGIDERRLDEELFGTSESQPGRVGQAAGGTLVLQGISGLAMPIQAKLLRVIREGLYEMAGGRGPSQPVKCRFIAITTDDLEAKARAGEFRSDLYYALSSFVIKLPPIRQRHGDLRLLVENSLAKLKSVAEAYGVEQPKVSDRVMDALASHLWPGNIDELDSVLKRAMIEQKGNLLVSEGLLEALSGDSVVPTAEATSENRHATDWSSFTDLRVESGSDTLYADAVAEVERKLFTRVLHHTRGNQAQASRFLGITRASLRKKLRQHGMSAKPPDE